VQSGLLDGVDDPPCWRVGESGIDLSRYRLGDNADIGLVGLKDFGTIIVSFPGFFYDDDNRLL